MVTRTRAKKKIVEVPRLRQDGENWLDYHAKLFEAAEAQGLLGLLNGTSTKPNEPWNPRRIAAWLRDDTEAQYLLATTTPQLIWNHFTISTAHNMFQHLQSLFETTTTTTLHDVRSNDSTRVAAHTAGTPDDCTRTQRAANEKVCSTNGVSGGSGRRQNSSRSNGTRRERERTTTDHGKVEMRARVGEKGAKLRGKVDEGAAAVRGPGMKTTDLQADGVGLATPVSSPQDHQTFVKPTKPHKNALTTMPQRTPCDRRSHGEDQSAAGIE